jgi:hypothetical protein
MRFVALSAFFATLLMATAACDSSDGSRGQGSGGTSQGGESGAAGQGGSAGARACELQDCTAQHTCSNADYRCHSTRNDTSSSLCYPTPVTDASSCAASEQVARAMFNGATNVFCIPKSCPGPEDLP